MADSAQVMYILCCYLTWYVIVCYMLCYEYGMYYATYIKWSTCCMLLMCRTISHLLSFWNVSYLSSGSEGVPPPGHQRGRLHQSHPHASHQSGQRGGTESTDQRAGTCCFGRLKFRQSCSPVSQTQILAPGLKNIFKGESPLKVLFLSRNRLYCWAEFETTEN